MAKPFRIVAAILVLASVLGCSRQISASPVQTPASTPCVGQSITIGEISATPATVISNVLPFARYLASRLKDSGIACGHVKVTDTVAGMIDLINNQEVDIYFDSVFPATMVSDATGAEPILRRWRNCDPEYYSIIFATKASGIASLEDLRGRMMAMDRPDSTSGLVLPAAYLLDHGLRLIVKPSYDEAVTPDQVGVYFTGADANTLDLLHSGKLSAGATDDYNFGQWQKSAPDLGLQVLAATESEPRQAVLLRPGLDSGLRAAIKNELLRIGEEPAAQDALQLAVGTCKFDDTPEGIAAAFARMRTKWNQLKLVPGWDAALTQGH